MIGVFKWWKQWFKTRPLYFKWFLLILLLRPYIDIFWAVKKMGFFSPPQIVGIAIPVLILYSFIQGKMPNKKFKSPDSFFYIFSLLYILNFAFLLASDFSLANFGGAIKAITPILLYFYLRRVIRNREDLFGILYTFCFAALFPLGMLLYEMIFGSFDVTFFTPEGADRLTAARGGAIRLQGLFADLFNYASYLIGTLLSILFLKYNSLQIRNSNTINKYVIAIIIINLFGIFAIKHAATIGVFITITILYILYTSKKAVLKNIFLTILMGIGGFIIYSSNSDITTIFTKEVQVLNDEADSNIALNGRIGSWVSYYDYWSKLNTANHLFGVGFEGKAAKRLMVNAIGDYPRIFFSVGVIGFLAYIMFYFFMLKKSRRIIGANKFLYVGAMLIILLYSFTLSPTVYGGALYPLILSVYSYFNSNSPKRIAYETFYYKNKISIK